MRRLEDSAPEKVPSERFQQLDPGERGVGDHVRHVGRHQARAVERESKEYAPILEEDEQAQEVVATIAALSVAIALAFLAGEVLRRS